MEIKIRKINILTNMQSVITTITSEGKEVTSEYDGTSYTTTYIPFSVKKLQGIYGKYVYFLPEAIADNDSGYGITWYPWSWIADSVIRVDLTSGEKTSIPFDYDCYTLSSSRFLINMAEKSNELFCIDLKKGEKKLISNKCVPLCSWYEGDACSVDPVTIIEDEIYYFEDSPSGARVVRYNMASDEWEYLTESIADITSDITARPYKGFAHYRINDQWYRYFYNTKTTEETDWIPSISDYNDYAEYCKIAEDYTNVGYFRYHYATGVEESISWDSLTNLN